LINDYLGVKTATLNTKRLDKPFSRSVTTNRRKKYITRTKGVAVKYLLDTRRIMRRVELSRMLSKSVRYRLKSSASVRRYVVMDKIRRFHDLLFSLLSKYTAKKLRYCILKLRKYVAVPRRYILRVAGRLYIVPTLSGNSIKQNVVTEAALYRTRILRGFSRRLAYLSRSAIPSKSKGRTQPKCKGIDKPQCKGIKKPKSKVIKKPKGITIFKPIGRIKKKNLVIN